MKVHLLIILVSSFLLLVSAQTGSLFPQFGTKRRSRAEISLNGKTSKSTSFPIGGQSKNISREVKSLTVSELGERPSFSFDGLNGGSLTAGLIPSAGLTADIASVLAKAGLVSSFIATALSSLLLPLQITEVILSIVAISMAVAYSMGVTRFATLRSDANGLKELTDFPEFEGTVLSPDLIPPGFIQINKVENKLSSVPMKKKKKADIPQDIWNTVFESSRSLSNSEFLQDLSNIVINALLKYS